MISTTNFIGSDGVDVGSKLLDKEYFNSVYLNIANQYITPELWGWGVNSKSQLGNNDFTNKSTPITTFAGGSNWKTVSTGNYHTSAIKTDGTLWTWGGDNNFHLQLGINNANPTASTPVTTFAGGNNWKQVSCGSYHTAAIKTDGTLWVWGNNYHSKLGINSDIVVSTPVTTFAGGSNWKQISCGLNHNAAIKTDGTLWTWGDNDYGQLGINNQNATASTPVTTFAGGNNWKQVSCGYLHTAAIKTDGTLWVWGQGSFLQLGENWIFNRSTPITTFLGGTDWRKVSCGQFNTAAIKTDGTLWVWGSNILGININATRGTPVTTFAGGTNWKEVDCGANHMSAIKTDGTLWTWGNNSVGQLATNSSLGKLTPVTTFLGGNNWRFTSAGPGFNIAIRSFDD